MGGAKKTPEKVDQRLSEVEGFVAELVRLLIKLPPNVLKFERLKFSEKDFGLIKERFEKRALDLIFPLELFNHQFRIGVDANLFGPKLEGSF